MPSYINKKPIATQPIIRATKDEIMSFGVGELCRCGREGDKLHCATCGSATIYALISKLDLVTMPDGIQVEVPCYRCRRCGVIFNLVTLRLSCEAPKFETHSMKKKRLQDKAEEAIRGLSSPERMKLITSLFNKDVVTTADAIVDNDVAEGAVQALKDSTK